MRIFPPPQADPAGGAALWANLVGLLRPAWRRWLAGQPHLAWEYVADRDTLLLGRSTYEDFAGYWPVAAASSEDGFERDHGRNMTAMRKVVVSSTLTDPVWAGTETAFHAALVEL